MSLCYSLETVPELAGLGMKERMIVLMYYQANKAALPTPKTESAFVGAIILGLIAGAFGGALITGNVTWAPIIGGFVTIAVLTCPIYLFSLRTEAPKFRKFLQAGHSQMLLNSLRQSSGGPSSDDLAEPNSIPRLNSNSPLPSHLSQGELSTALNSMSFHIARTGEVLELCGESSEEALAMFEAAVNCEREGLIALKRFRVGAFLRLTKEAQKNRQNAFRALRHSNGLFKIGEASLNKAKALSMKLDKEFEP